ncbi:MAG: hypothetical protein ACR2NP_16540 [Pirellulaceae bacterium]
MRFAGLILITLATVMLTGCRAEPIDVADLNQVLNELAASLAQLDAHAADQQSQKLVGITADEENTVDRQAFLDAFANNLNRIELISQPFGVVMVDSGDLFGFGDLNSDNRRDQGEVTFFRVQLDEDNDRLIASDGEGHFRDHDYDAKRMRHYTFQLIGTMLGRKRAYYVGHAAPLRPEFGPLEMSPKDYYPDAVIKARRRKGS